METDELLAHIRRLKDKVQGDSTIYGVHTEVKEFLRVYVGPKSAFYEAVASTDPRKLSDERAAQIVRMNLGALLSSIESGAQSGISPKRQAELDVVSDFLTMANDLLETKRVHPAAPAVLIGATLEEFLRTWIDAEGLTLGSRKPGLEAYSQVLRDADMISKQDGKDITAWAGVRNHAAHGDWDDVSDRQRVRLMLEGVNLFIRKYTTQRS